MPEATQILISNLTNALEQVNLYLALGIATAISAFVLDRRPHDPAASPPVPLSGFFVPMAPEAAKLVLLGICFVAGLLANNAVDSARGIVSMLQAKPELLKAACTYSSVATAAIGYRVIAALLPALFLAPILWRVWSGLRALPLKERSNPMALLFLLVPYAALVIAMFRLRCGAWS